MVAYSARDGHLAQDGDEANSPFAQALVQHLREPGLEVGLLFRKVHDTVLTKTNREQEPFTYGALPAEALYFNAATSRPADEQPSNYVIQLASKKSTIEALTVFAEMQNKHPSLLGNYRPMVQKADLGSKGTWYRLRVGPIADKDVASNLCRQLKAQGEADCIVASQ